MPESLDHEQLVQLRNLIYQSFSLDEFRTLCFDLGVRYDDLPGEGLRTRVTELVSLCDRTGRIEHLLAHCVQQSPQTNWLGLNNTIRQEVQPIEYTPPIQNPRQIFISYAYEDSDFAHRLADDLRHHKWAVWIAPDSIHPGEKWVDAINRGLVESTVFLLVLTPQAVNSSWVTRETNAAIGLEHQNNIRLIPLDVALVATPPPLWQAYQWVSFQKNYKDGLERLMQELQPAEMNQLAILYQQCQQAMNRRDWAIVQTLGAQIITLYPDYRATEERLALARHEAEREQANQAEAAHLYPRLKTAVERADWANALALTDQIDQLAPNYQDVAQLKDRTRRGLRQQQKQKQQKQWQSLQEQLRRFSRWGLSGGAIIILLIACMGTAVLLSQLINNDEDSTPTPTQTRPGMATLELPPNPQLHTAWIRPTDGMVMVFVPGGTFQMGSTILNVNAQNDEQPQHEVTLSGFWIDHTEVTNAMYENCVVDEDCAKSSYANDVNYNGPNYPVIGVVWEGADAYCTWAGGQLPSEAQWEYAARGNDGRLYPWGDESPTCDLAQYSACDGNTVPVGSFPDGNSWVGAADMSGNAWEWVMDWYDDDYYETSPSENPIGPVSGDYKVLRGGSWLDNASLRLTLRFARQPFTRTNSFGFRCVVTPGS